MSLCCVTMQYLVQSALSSVTFDLFVHLQWWKRPCQRCVKWGQWSMRSPGARWTPHQPTSLSGRHASRWNAALDAATQATCDARQLASTTAQSRYQKKQKKHSYCELRRKLFRHWCKPFCGLKNLWRKDCTVHKTINHLNYFWYRIVALWAKIWWRIQIWCICIDLHGVLSDHIFSVALSNHRGFSNRLMMMV